MVLHRATGADQLHYFSIGIVLSAMFGFFRWLSSAALTTGFGPNRPAAPLLSRQALRDTFCEHILWKGFVSSRHSRSKSHGDVLFCSTSCVRSASAFSIQLRSRTSTPVRVGYPMW